MSIDGFVAKADGKNDWMTWYPDDELLAFMNSNADSADTLLLGRKMTDGFIQYWEALTAREPQNKFAQKMASIAKVVFTKTLSKSTWNNTVLAKGNLAEEIGKLKKQDGKDIIVFGGASFVSSLIKEGLIDEYYLLINPVAIGNGLPIFKSLDRRQEFTPIQTRLFPGGKTLLIFKPIND